MNGQKCVNYKHEVCVSRFFSLDDFQNTSLYVWEHRKQDQGAYQSRNEKLIV